MAGEPGWAVTVNQLDFKPTAPAKLVPVVVTGPPVNCRVSVVTRPPRSPRPLRPVTCTEVSRPSPAPNADSIVVAGTVALHVWLGFEAVASPASGTAGNTPPAV